jgi:hypothetical protein
VSNETRTHLKNVFWPNIFVGASLQILDIQQYASGLRPTRRIRSDGESRNAGRPTKIVWSDGESRSAGRPTKIVWSDGESRSAGRPTKIIGSGGKSSNAGKLGPAAILNQNPIFEMDSNRDLKL